MLNPPDDGAFDAFVDRAVRAGTSDPEDLQDRLRRRYPRAIVRRRDLSGERAPTWYVYRDGHWVRSRTA